MSANSVNDSSVSETIPFASESLLKSELFQTSTLGLTEDESVLLSHSRARAVCRAYGASILSL